MANSRKNVGEKRERINDLFDDDISNALVSGFSREREMSAMVSALAHVVAGGNEVVVAPDGACKRGRDEESIVGRYTHSSVGISKLGNYLQPFIY